MTQRAPLSSHGRELGRRLRWVVGTGLVRWAYLFENRDIYRQEALEPLLQVREEEGREAPRGGWRFHQPSDLWDWTFYLSALRTGWCRRPFLASHLLLFRWNGLHGREQRRWLALLLLLVTWWWGVGLLTRHWRLPHGLGFYLQRRDSDLRSREFQPRLASYRKWALGRWISRRRVTGLPLVWALLLSRFSSSLWKAPSRRKRVRWAGAGLTLRVRRWLPVAEEYGRVRRRRLPLQLLLEGRRVIFCRREALEEGPSREGDGAV